ncbi:MAG: VWA domain-containing protein [Acidobacteria bacterium]|nr:VWA domain-containing protein [Acidobacteriota bacterium]
MTSMFQNEWPVILRALGMIFLAFAGSVLGQDDEPIKVDTELVTFEVTVTGKDGKPISGLKAEDFRIFDNGVERKVDFFQPITGDEQKRPLLVIFALDVSGSMTAAEMESLRNALKQSIKRLGSPNTYFAIMTFAMRVRTVAGFSNIPQRLDRSLEKLSRDTGGLSTHAYDAVDDAIRLIVRKSPKSIRGQAPKRSVVVITDGFPVGDVVAPETVIERANAAEVSVYSIIMPSYSRLQGTKRPLMTPFEASGLVDRTGGINLYAGDKSLENLFVELESQVTGSYAVAFYPEPARSADDYREVRIETQEGLKLRQNRPGYRPR